MTTIPTTLAVTRQSDTHDQPRTRDLAAHLGRDYATAAIASAELALDTSYRAFRNQRKTATGGRPPGRTTRHHQNTDLRTAVQHHQRAVTLTNLLTRFPTELAPDVLEAMHTELQCRLAQRLHTAHQYLAPQTASDDHSCAHHGSPDYLERDIDPDASTRELIDEGTISGHSQEYATTVANFLNHIDPAALDHTRKAPKTVWTRNIERLHEAGNILAWLDLLGLGHQHLSSEDAAEAFGGISSELNSHLSHLLDTATRQLGAETRLAIRDYPTVTYGL